MNRNDGLCPLADAVLDVGTRQIVFVVLLFPALDDLIRSGWTRLRPAVSIAIGLLAAYWFIQRAFFG